MYLHLGLDMMVDMRKVLGIFDIKILLSDDLLAQKNIVGVKTQSCSSFILTDKEVYFSEISPLTLKKRFDNLFMSDF